MTTISTHPTLTNGLLANLSFNGNLLDDRGSNHGTYAGTGSAPFAIGKNGCAFDHPGGVQQYVSVANPVTFDTANVGVAAWVYADFTPSSYHTVASRSIGANFAYEFRLRSDNYWELYVNAAGGSFDWITLSRQAVGWTFVAFWYDGTTMFIRENERTTSKTHNYGGRIVSLPTIPVTIGGIDGSVYGYYYPWDGRFDQVAIYNRKLETSELDDLYNSGVGLFYAVEAPVYTSIMGHPTLKQGLISHFSFEDNVLDDQTNFNGTAVGSPTYGAGKIGTKAIRLSGSSQYVNLGTDTRLTPGCISICAWVKFVTLNAGDYPGIVTRRDGNTDYLGYPYCFMGANTKISWAVRSSPGGLDYLEVTPTTPTAWHFYTATYDGSYLRIFIDGELVSEKKHAWGGLIGYFADYPARIGYTPALGAGAYLNGWVDGVCIYDRALTESEARALYNNGNGLPFGTFSAATTMAGHRSLLYRMVSCHKLDGNLQDALCVNDATIRSGTAYYDTGKFTDTQALDLRDTSGQYALTGRSEPYNNRCMAITAWVYLDSGLGIRFVASKRNETGDHMSLYFNGGAWTFGASTGGSEYVNVSQGASGWNFVCAYYDGRTMFIRVNSASNTASHTGWLISSTKPLYIGGVGTGDGAGEMRWDGRIQNLCYWDRPLYPSEINDLYNSASGIPVGTIPASAAIIEHPALLLDRVGYWNLDADASDVSGNGVSGTLVNSPANIAAKIGNGYTLSKAADRGNIWFNHASYSPLFNARRFSFALWIYPKSYVDKTYSGVFGKTAYVGGSDYVQFHLLQWNEYGPEDFNHEFAFAMRGASGTYRTVRSGDDSIVLNTWTHLAVVYNGNEIKLFMNGLLRDRVINTEGVNIIAYPLRVGYRSNGTAQGNILIPDGMHGDAERIIDEMFFAQRPWSDWEVAQLYARGAGLSYLNPAVAPRVKSTGVVLATNQVRVDFDELMNHNTDLTLAANYVFSGPSTLTTQSVPSATDVGDETRVTVQFTGEMQTGGAYHVVASNMIDANDGLPVNPSYDTADFTGEGVTPWVASAAMTGGGPIVVDFDELMLHDAALSLASNYALTGPTTLTPTTATPNDSGGVTHVTVAFTGVVTHGGSYQVEVSNVHDLVGNVVNPDHDTASFAGINPRVASAAAQDSVRVRVTFNTEMKHVSDVGPTDSLNAANYSVVGPVLTHGILSVVLIQASPTIVDLNLTEEMTHEGAYEVTVSSVLSNDGYALVVNSAEFTGIGVLPQLESDAELTAEREVTVVFSELMTHDEDLEDPDNYTFPSPPNPSALTASGVEAEDSGGKTQCVVTFTGGMLDGNYQVNAANVIDLAGNPLDPEHDTAEFLGVCAGPWVVDPGLTTEHTVVYVRFTKRVLHADEIENYSILPALDVLDAEQYGDVYTYRLTTDPQIPLEEYTLSVSSSVTDLDSNPVNPAHNTLDFIGQANEPPESVLTYPTAGSKGFAIREAIQVTARDPNRGVGIDETTWNITLSRTKPDGTPEILHPLIDGELQGNFQGEKSGDPDLDSGVTWAFVPRDYWAERAVYSVTSEVKDREDLPAPATALGTFETSSAVYAEDMALERTEIDTKILTRLTSPSLKNSQFLKGQLIPRCSQSRDQTVQARTLLYWSSRVEARSLVLTVADFSSLSGLKFGNRTEIISLYEQVAGYIHTAARAVDELRSLSAESKDLLRKLLRTASPLHVVSTMATIVVLASFQE